MKRYLIVRRSDIHALQRYEAEDEEDALHAISARISLSKDYTTAAAAATTTAISEGTWFYNTCPSSPDVLGANQQNSSSVWPSEQSKIHHPQPVHWSPHGGIENQGARGDFRPHHSPHYPADSSITSTNLQYRSAEYTDAMLAQRYPHMGPPVSHIYDKFVDNSLGHDCTATGVWPVPY